MSNNDKPSLEDLHRILDDSFVVQHISVPLDCCNSSDDAQQVKRRMESVNFDLMGLKENGNITGYVRREDLKDGSCLKYRRAFLNGEIVSNRTPLGRLLRMMVTRPQLFVLEHAEINGVVTRADLQKPPVRMVLFGLLSLHEMYMLLMVRVCYSTEQLKKIPRLEDARIMLAKRLDRNEDIDLADCLTLTEKNNLLLNASGFSEFLGFASSKDAELYFKNVVILRNKLAHGHDLVDGFGWDQMAKTIINLESFLSKCDEKYDDFQLQFAKK